MAVVGRVLLIEKGDYSGSAIYNRLDWVRNNGAAWVCKVDGTQGIAPPTLPTTSNDNWQLLAADGSVSGSVAWNSVTNKPFSLVDTDDFEVDSNEVLKLKNGSGGDTVSWNQIQSTGTKIAEITINGNKDDVYAPTSGGSSTFAGLSDTDINNPQADQIVQYKSVGGELKLQNVAMPQGGHDMPSNANILTAIDNATNTNDKVSSLYGIKEWSNCDAIQILTAVSADDDGVGTWEDDATWETGSRTGWITHSALYGILSDDDVEIEPVFKITGGDAVGLYAMRIDDAVTGSTGGVALKFTAPITASGYVGIKLKHLRTNTEIV